MTHSQDQRIPRNRWEAEQLWNVSLLPVAAAPRGAPPRAVVVELPLEKTQRPTLQRNAA